MPYYLKIQVSIFKYIPYAVISLITTFFYIEYLNNWNWFCSTTNEVALYWGTAVMSRFQVNCLSATAVQQYWLFVATIAYVYNIPTAVLVCN